MLGFLFRQQSVPGTDPAATQCPRVPGSSISSSPANREQDGVHGALPSSVSSWPWGWGHGNTRLELITAVSQCFGLGGSHSPQDGA